MTVSADRRILIGSDIHAKPNRHLPLWLVKAGLWTMAMSIVIVPVGVALTLLNRVDGLPKQPKTNPVVVSEQERQAWRAMGAGLPAQAPPVVLAYHDVRPGSKEGYVVSPELFEKHLIALAEAGYRTATSAEYVDYLNGKPAGPRSVYLTFDDGTEGLYLYADRILARQRAHGASYLISGRVDTHRPYYLTWAEVQQMHESGRWDFQAHTHDLHTRGLVGPEHADGSLLTGRAWNAKTGHLETAQEHRGRVFGDLAAQLRDFEQHNLPRPQLFAYPFSDLGSRNDKATVQTTRSIVGNLFTGAFTNKSAAPTPTSRRSSVAAEIERIEVFSNTTADELVAKVASWTAISPGAQPTPLADPARWWEARTRSMPALDVFTGKNRRPGNQTYVQADYAPYAAADWVDYRVEADLRGLQRGGNNANITVRVGGRGSVAVRTSYVGVQAVDPDTGAVIAAQKLTGSEHHNVRIEVTGTATQVQVDKGPVMRIPSKGGPGSTGGIGLAARRDAGSELPVFAKLTVSAITGAAR